MTEVYVIEPSRYRVSNDGYVQRYDVFGEHWVTVDWGEAKAVRAWIEMHSRANEYASLGERQAQRIAELERILAEVDRAVANVTEHCYQAPKHRCAACGRSLVLVRQLVATACPCGLGPDHSPGWCSRYSGEARP